MPTFEYSRRQAPHRRSAGAWRATSPAPPHRQLYSYDYRPFTQPRGLFITVLECHAGVISARFTSTPIASLIPSGPRCRAIVSASTRDFCLAHRQQVPYHFSRRDPARFSPLKAQVFARLTSPETIERLYIRKDILSI